MAVMARAAATLLIAVSMLAGARGDQKEWCYNDVVCRADGDAAARCVANQCDCTAGFGARTSPGGHQVKYCLKDGVGNSNITVVVQTEYIGVTCAALRGAGAHPGAVMELQQKLFAELALNPTYTGFICPENGALMTAFLFKVDANTAVDNVAPDLDAKVVAAVQGSPLAKAWDVQVEARVQVRRAAVVKQKSSECIRSSRAQQSVLFRSDTGKTYCSAVACAKGFTLLERDGVQHCLFSSDRSLFLGGSDAVVALISFSALGVLGLLWVFLRKACYQGHGHHYIPQISPPTSPKHGSGNEPTSPTHELHSLSPQHGP